MIISCPECSGPFEVPDDRIAALVQVQCPHCAFRMILDFAAANDPSLVEEGMRMASGFRTAADYRRAAAGPSPRPVPTPTPVEPAPAELGGAEPAPEPPRLEPDRRALLGPPTIAEPPAAAAESGPFHAPPIPTEGAEQSEPEEAPPPRRRRDTMVGRAPKRTPILPALDPVLELDYDDEQPTMLRSSSVLDEPRSVRLPAEPAVDVGTEEDEEVAPPRATASSGRRPGADATRPFMAPPSSPFAEAPVEDRPAGAEALVDLDVPSARSPGHAPPTGRPAPRAGAPGGRESGTLPMAGPEREPVEYEQPRGTSVLGVSVLVVLLLLAVGLVGASLALESTPDPRPLLEDLYRQYVKP